jgi:twitching motility protein PilT
METTFDLVDLLSRTVSAGASDLHLCAETAPMMRVNGSLAPLGDSTLTVEDCRELILGALTEKQRSRLEEDWELDFALQVDEIGRFRGNAHYARGTLGAAFRFIPHTIPELGNLGHRDTIFRVCGLARGLVLVTGVTGSGKSTTMASMIQQISRDLDGVIVTIEDPVEYVFPNARSVIKQREVGSDTKSFSEALRHALRQDPDVIFVGEMRDPETIGAALTAAETGHLVLATLHTIDAPKAIDRMVDAFPGDQQPQIIAQLANSLEAVISQRLIPTEDGKGRVLATETLIASAAVRACIRDKRWDQLVGLIEIGAKDGMHTIDEDLSGLYRSRQISKEEAILNARDRDNIEALLREVAPKKKLFG